MAAEQFDAQTEMDQIGATLKALKLGTVTDLN